MKSRLFIVAGEASGDAHGGKLAAALLDRDPTLILEGTGGAAMEKAGVRLQHDIRNLGVVGVVEVFSQWRAIWRAYRGIRQRLREAPPSALVLIDYPDFNLRLARTARRLGIPVIYYVSPQLWAWRPGRMKTIARNVQLMLVLFAFEQDLYRAAGVSSRWVGHPLLDGEAGGDGLETEALRWGASPAERVLALLPGSRALEVSRLLPPMLAAAARVCAEGLFDRIVIAAAPSVDRALIETAVARAGSPARLTVVNGQAGSVLRAARAAVVASGTATLQAAVIGTPMVMVYRVAPLTAWIGRRLITTPHLALVNVVAGRRVVPELVQDAMTVDAITAEVRRLATDEAADRVMRDGLAEVRAKLGAPGASARAAAAIVEFLARERAA